MSVYYDYIFYEGLKMSTTTWFPSLSQDSWVTDSSLQADYLLAQAYETNYSQSQLYPGKVTSIAKIIQENNNNIGGTCTALAKSLTEYFSRYFHNVVVEVKQTSASVASGSSLAEIEMYISVTDNKGVVISLGKLLDITNSKINMVKNIINN